ncbi:hypothetical protein K445DRAFT_26476 [Daldinia sp. EC12]|nr:hypothetical protein K445DRAFT_26476 [Daldinia sp. EC12]
MEHCATAGLMGKARKGDGKNAVTSYAQRFTRRAPRSSWSKRNIKHVARLKREGRITEAGRRVVEAAKADGRWEAAYARQATAELPEEFLVAVIAVPAAQATFDRLSSRRDAVFSETVRAISESRNVEYQKRGETICRYPIFAKQFEDLHACLNAQDGLLKSKRVRVCR